MLLSESKQSQNATMNDAYPKAGSANCKIAEVVALQFDRDPSTLCEQLQGLNWPIHYKVREFNRNAAP